MYQHTILTQNRYQLVEMQELAIWRIWHQENPRMGEDSPLHRKVM